MSEEPLEKSENSHASNELTCPSPPKKAMESVEDETAEAFPTTPDGCENNDAKEDEGEKEGSSEANAILVPDKASEVEDSSVPDEEVSEAESQEREVEKTEQVNEGEHEDSVSPLHQREEEDDEISEVNQSVEQVSGLLVSEELGERLNGIESVLSDLETKIEKKIISNNHNERIIDDLHAELQKYKAGLGQQLLKPIVDSLIQLRDDMNQTIKKLPEKEGLTIEQAVRTLDTYPEDVIDILIGLGLDEYNVEEGSVFDPKSHRVGEKKVTSDKTLDKTIISSIKPGYTWNGRIIRRCHVCIYIFDPSF